VALGRVITGVNRMDKFVPIGLGDRVKDPVTGFAGIVVCETKWLHGCIRLGVQPETMRKGDAKIPEAQYFDQSQLILIKSGIHKPVIVAVIPTPPKTERRGPGGPARETPGFSR
jgi:hypothetical protein